MTYKVIKAWKEQAVIAAGRGFPEVTCAHSACVSLTILRKEFAIDPEFKARFDEAAANAPAPPKP